MSLPLTYLGVVLIWATTPLAIQWSTIAFAPLPALALRMGISLVLVAVYAWARGGLRLDFRRRGLLYLAGAMGIFPTMVLVYLASAFISSGLMSVLFGMAPFMVALCSWLGFRVNPIDAAQGVALLLGIAGLAVICIGSEALGPQAIWGILLVLCSSFLFALSSLLVKRWGGAASPAEQLLGSLLIAVPPLGLAALLTTEEFVWTWHLQSVGALLFLSLVGSFVGYLAYYRLVQALDVMLVALIPLITPMLAMWLGYSLNGETVTPRLMLGSGLIVVGLALFNRKVFYPRRLFHGLRR